MSVIALKLAEDTPGFGRAGETIQLAMQPQDVHVAEELATYLAGYRPFDYRAGEVSKEILVDKSRSHIRTFNSDNAFRHVKVKGSVQGGMPEVDAGSGTEELHVTERFIGSFVPAQTEWEASYDARQAATRRVRRALDLDLELDVWKMLATVASWDSGNVEDLTSGTKWSANGSDPIKNIQDRMEASAQPVAGVAMSLKVANAFLRHDKVKEYVKLHVGDNGATRMMGELNAGATRKDFFLPGIGTVMVVESKVKNEADGKLVSTLGDHVVLFSAPPGVPMDGEEIATTYTFRRKGLSGVGYDVREVRVELRGGYGGTMVVGATADKPVMTGKNCGGLIRAVL